MQRVKRGIYVPVALESEIYSTAPGKKDVEFSFADREASKGFHHYYVRLEQEDGMVAWSSPFFVTYR